MKITRYEQSCLIVEEGESRVLIDPGDDFTTKHDRDELGRIDAVFYTHEHGDHLDVEFYKILQSEGIAAYGN